MVYCEIFNLSWLKHDSFQQFWRVLVDWWHKEADLESKAAFGGEFQGATFDFHALAVLVIALLASRSNGDRTDFTRNSVILTK